MKHLIKTIPITKSSTVIDIGANEGQEIEALLPTYCEIHSFEPHPMFFKELHKKYISLPNIHLNQSAAWKSDGKMKLYYKRGISARNGGASLIKDKMNLDLQLNVEVKCIDIAKYISGLNKDIDLLKIDAEGAEYEILNHLFETGAFQKIKNIYYEDHSRKIHDCFICNSDSLNFTVCTETSKGRKWCELKNSVISKYKKSNTPLNIWHG
tara:strand:- start:499 stop:1128 length:630 start_codon:yes stop_codon:yes gene_type:complete